MLHGPKTIWGSAPQKKSVKCPYCHRLFANCHKCPVLEAMKSKPRERERGYWIATDHLGFIPRCSIMVFPSLCYIGYDSIFCSPLTASSLPVKHLGPFSAVISGITKSFLHGEVLGWKTFAFPRGGSAISRHVNTYLTPFCNGNWETLLTRRIPRVSEVCLTRSKEKRIESLARAGCFSSAIRALGDNVPCDTPQEDVYELLKKLHPATQKRVAECQLKFADIFIVEIDFTNAFI